MKRPDPGVRWTGFGSETGRLDDPVPRLDCEADPFVQRTARLGRNEDERPASRGLGGVDRGLRQRHSEAPPTVCGIDPHRPDPPDWAVDRRDRGADDGAIRICDERPAARVRRREFEMRVPVAELVEQHRPGRRLDVGGRHRPDQRLGHDGHPTEPDRGGPGGIVPASTRAGAISISTVPTAKRSIDVGRRRSFR